MTTTIGHGDRPPAAGAVPKVPATSRSRRSMLALAAVESGRLLRHPAVLAATALSAWLLWRAGGKTVPVLHYADIATQLPLAPLAAAALLASNLAVLRPHRDGAVDLHGATRLSMARRSVAHLLSVLPLVVLGSVLVVADLAWLAGVTGRTGSPNAAEAATGPALIVLGGCLGVLLGRLWRSVAVAPLVLVVVAAGSLTLGQLYIGGHDTRPYAWLGTLLPPVTIDPPPAALLGRPASWHLVYLLGAAAVLGALAVWRSQARMRRRAQAATAVVLVGTLAVTTAAAVVQTRPTSPALAARWLAAQVNPAAQLVCQRRGPAVYCVFPGFEPQIGLWEPTVRAVVAGVPPAAAARALPVTVAQRVGWFHLTPEDEPGAAESPGVAQGVGQQGRPVAPVGTTWGRQGQLLAETQARLAVNVAARLVAPPDTVTPPSGAGSKSNPGPGPSAPAFGCNARAAVALWLAARVSPQVAEGIGRGVANTPDPTFTLTHDVDTDDVSWGVREGRFALALLERPGDQVAQIMQGNWDLLTRPNTPLEQLAQLLGVQPPPVSPDISGSAGPVC